MKSSMNERTRVLLLAAIMIVACVAAVSITLTLLYNHEIDMNKQRLQVTAKSQARLIEAVGRFDAEYNTNYKDGPAAATLSQITSAHKRYQGFGNTGEFTLARLEGEMIIFLLGHRHDTLEKPMPIPFNSDLAEPMRLALSGQSGTIIGLDYRGETVLAAYEPVDVLNLGIVAKIDLTEIRAPFIRSGLIASGASFVIITAGTLLFFFISNPIIVQMKEYSRDLEKEIEVRKRAEDDIRMFKTISDEANYGTLICDMAGNIIYNNSALAEMHGYEPDRLTGKNISILHAHGQGDTMEGLSLKLIREGSLAAEDARHRKRDGTIFPIISSATVINDNSGKPLFISGTIIDVTEQIELQNQLRQSQKMEAIGQLAGGIAHDFNNILQAIQGYIEFAKEGLSTDETRYKDINEIHKASDKAADLTRQLLAFSRRQILQPKTLDINNVISDNLKMLGRLIGEHIELAFIPGKNVDPIHADPRQLEQILMNLFVNARDAMPTGGRITIETGNHLIDDKFCEEHPWANPGRYIYFSISDTGCGMSRETLDHIYEPFFTTKKVGEGTGLGLATTYGIVKQHDGLIHVYSEPDKGTAFRIYLPVSSQEFDSRLENEEAPPAGGTETILFAEDDDAIRATMPRILEKFGYRIISAPDGNRAMELYKEHADEIALVILDVVMPKSGGREVYDRIMKTNPEVRVLFSSGYSPEGIHTRFILEEGLELIQKPFKSDDLLRKIRMILDAPPGNEA